MMRIDRSKFLALTASMAAGGCAATQTPEPAPEPAPVVAPAQVLAEPPATPPTPVEQQLAVDPANTQEPDDPQEGVEMNATQPGQVGVVAAGPPPICGQLRAPPGPHCESFDTLQQDCEQVLTALEPAVAQAAGECLARKSGTQRICDMWATGSCAEASLGKATILPESARPCAAVLQRCQAPGRRSSVTMQSCQAFLSSVRASARSQSATCLSESCDLPPCFFSLP